MSSSSPLSEIRRAWAGARESRARDGVAGSAPGAEFQHLSQENQYDDCRRRLEIHGDGSPCAMEGVGKEIRRDGSGDAIHVSHTCSDPDQGEHVQVATHN